MADGQAHQRVQSAAAELYAGALADFVPRRTALVKQARAAKDREAATEIGGLRKPSVAAWTVNGVVRGHPDVVARLRDVGVRLRHAQATLDATSLATLRGERDQALSHLLDAARQVGAAAGTSLSTVVESEIRDTAIAALADEAAQEVAWSGALTRALTYSGFGEVDVADAVAQTSTGVRLVRIEGGADRAGEPDAGPEGTPEPEPEPEDLGPRLAEAEREVASTEREVAARLAEVDQARRRSEAVAARLERLRSELATAEQEAEVAEVALRRATTARRTASAALSEAEERVERTREQQDAAQR